VTTVNQSESDQAIRSAQRIQPILPHNNVHSHKHRLISSSCTCIKPHSHYARTAYTRADRRSLAAIYTFVYARSVSAALGTAGYLVLCAILRVFTRDQLVTFAPGKRADKVFCRSASVTPCACPPSRDSTRVALFSAAAAKVMRCIQCSQVCFAVSLLCLYACSFVCLELVVSSSASDCLNECGEWDEVN